MQPTAGGLANAVAAFARGEPLRWIGWPGYVPPHLQAHVERRLNGEFVCSPVFLPRPLVRRYYNGFANRALWPLLHSLPGHAEFLDAHWDGYREANELFARKVEQVAGPGATVWVHDYHLFLVPQILRDRRPDLKVGFFLHVPFPPPDVLRVLPWHREVLRGMLGSDLVGFHTYDYLQAFLACVRRFLGHDNLNGLVSLAERAVIADVFPLGIDFEDYAGSRAQPAVQAELAAVRDGFEGTKVSFSVERLDYTKGVLPQLKGIGRFLRDHPEWHGKYAHVLAVSPSREGVRTYKHLKREIDEAVGRINASFASVGWTPIRYVYRYLRPEELRALYLRADVALITPVRDGMNLVAKEYLAARAHDPGVLILSEFAGASKELLEALIVHPYRPTEVADAIARALAMDAAERRARSDPMVRRLRAGDARAWGRRFLERLDHAVSVGEGLRTRPLGPEPRRELVRAYEEAHRRLLLLDYDGTLVGLVDDPVRAAPPAEMTGLLRRLAARDGNEVVIVSGRPRPILEEWFGDLGVALCAEHGAWFRAASGEPWEAAPRADGTWKEVLRGVMQLTVQRIPGSFIEEKDYCLAWHYRRANGPIANDAARELFDTLVNLTASTDAAVQAGKGVVEVRCAGITKGQFYASHLAGGAWDFEFAAGDDATDETLFRALPPNAWSVHVGSSATAARHRLTAPQDLVRLLDDLEPRVAAAEGRGRGLPPEVARQAWDRSVPAEH